MSSPPLVSVVIPAYNARAYIADAVRSVLTQSWRMLECIVVDDGSSDGTADALAAIHDPRLSVLRQANGGVSRARNAGTEISRGSFVAYLDADDAWLPSKLARQMRIMQERHDVGLVFTGYAVTDEALKPKWIVRADEPQRRLRRWLALEGDGPGLGSTLLVRRALLDSVGGFDERLPPSEDLHLGMRLAALASVAAAPEPLVLYRTHAQQGHRNLGVFERNMLLIYADLLSDPGCEPARRRATANLYTRLLFHHLRHGDASAAATALRHAFEAQPSRTLLLPLHVGARRARERLRRALSGPPNLPEQLPQVLPAVGDVAPPG